MPKLGIHILGRHAAMPNNCYATVFGEFVGGHNHPTDHPEPLTDAQWAAFCWRTFEKTGTGSFGKHFWLGATAYQIRLKANFGQAAFVEFLKKFGAEVVAMESDTHTSWIVHRTPDFSKKLNEYHTTWKSEYIDDPFGPKPKRPELLPNIPPQAVVTNAPAFGTHGVLLVPPGHEVTYGWHETQTQYMWMEIKLPTERPSLARRRYWETIPAYHR